MSPLLKKSSILTENLQILLTWIRIHKILWIRIRIQSLRIHITMVMCCQPFTICKGPRILGLRTRYCVHMRIVLYIATSWRHSDGQCTYKGYIYCVVTTFRGKNVLDFCQDIYIYNETIIRLLKVQKRETSKMTSSILYSVHILRPPRPTILKPCYQQCIILQGTRRPNRPGRV